jgi:hypothetical protein
MGRIRAIGIRRSALIGLVGVLAPPDDCIPPVCDPRM